MSTPLHPLIVHFPIAFLTLAAVIQLIAIWRPRHLQLAATLLLGLGVVSGIVAYMTGDGGERYARSVFGATHDMIHRHENIAFIMLIVFSVLLVVKILFHLPVLQHKYAAQLRFLTPIIILLALAGLVLVYYTGHYGGELVYNKA